MTPNQDIVSYIGESNAEPNNEYLLQESTNDAFGPQKKDPITQDALVSIPSSPRKRRLLSLGLSICYTVLMLIFWVITAILCKKPIKGSGWYDSYSHFGPCYFQDSGAGLGLACKKSMEFVGVELAVNDRWRRTTRVMSAILSVTAIPISTAICSRGAVVYLQNQNQRRFALQKAVILADRGWTDPNILGSFLLNRKKLGEMNIFLLVSVCICALGR